MWCVVCVCVCVRVLRGRLESEEKRVQASCTTHHTPHGNRDKKLTVNDAKQPHKKQQHQQLALQRAQRQRRRFQSQHDLICKKHPGFGRRTRGDEERESVCVCVWGNRDRKNGKKCFTRIFFTHHPASRVTAGKENQLIKNFRI